MLKRSKLSSKQLALKLKLNKLTLLNEKHTVINRVLFYNYTDILTKETAQYIIKKKAFTI